MSGDWSWLNTVWLASDVLLWLLVLFVGFLLLGTLQALSRLSWRLDQLEATTPGRLGRNGLKPGKKAPDFTLPSVAGGAVSLHDFAGRKVLLVFTQSGCGPCGLILPELDRLSGPDVQVVVVNKGELAATREWAAGLGVRFPVLVQEGLDLSRKYETFATPFAFLIDERGVVASSGLIASKQHIGYVLSGARAGAEGHSDGQRSGPPTPEPEASPVPAIPCKEVEHV